MVTLNSGTKRTIIGGLIATLAILAGSFLINISSGSDARILLESMLPTVRFLSSAVMTSSSTILALMLTMLSMSSSKDKNFKKDYFEGVRQIAQLDTAVFIGATLLLIFISIPISNSQDVPQNWYMILYYSFLVAGAALGGALVTVMLMLYRTIIGLIHVLNPEQESHLIKDEQ